MGFRMQLLSTAFPDLTARQLASPCGRPEVGLKGTPPRRFTGKERGQETGLDYFGVSTTDPRSESLRASIRP